MNPYLSQVKRGKCPASAKLLSSIELDFVSAEGGTRTHTPLQEADFKSAASTIPPPRQSKKGGERIRTAV